MAFIFRIIFLFTLAFTHGYVNAHSTPSTNHYHTNIGNFNGYGTTPESACLNLDPSLDFQSNGTQIPTNVEVETTLNVGTCVDRPSRANASSVSYTFYPSQPPPPNCTDGKLLDSGTFAVTSTAKNLGCVGGCEGLFVGTAPTLSCAFNSNGFGGTCTNVKTGRYNATGRTCEEAFSPIPPSPESAPTPNPLTPENQCVKKGQTFGSVNGTIVCVPIGTPNTVTPPVQQDAPKEKTVTNNDGSTTTTTTTTTINNNGTVKTETTITNNPAPNDPNQTPTTTTSEKEQDKQGFCEENPTLKICKDEPESSFGGSCTGSFSCDGDAIQCAIAKEQHSKNCKLFNEETPLTAEGQSMLAGAGSNNPASIGNRETINLENMIDEGSNIGSGTFTDKVIPFKGGGITLPFSNLNFIMQLLGGFLLAGAYINAARIVGVR